MTEYWSRDELVNETTLGLIEWYAETKTPDQIRYRMHLRGVEISDLIQSSVLRLLEYADRLPKTTAHTTYICKMVYWTSLMSCRIRSGEKFPFQVEEDYLERCKDKYDEEPEADWDHILPTLDSRLRRLPKREQIVIRRRFGLFGKRVRTLQQIGDALHISKERVRQLQAMALARMKRMGV